MGRILCMFAVLSSLTLTALGCSGSESEATSDDDITSCKDCRPATALGHFVRPLMVKAEAEVDALPLTKQSAAATAAVTQHFGPVLAVTTRDGSRVHGSALIERADNSFTTLDGHNILELTTSMFIGDKTGFEYTTFLVHPTTGNVYVMRIDSRNNLTAYGPLAPPASAKLLGEPPANEKSAVSAAFNQGILGR